MIRDRGSSAGRSWIAGTLLLFAAATPSPANELKLERIAMLMRHGIRPPTKLQPIPVQYSPRTWPQWSVGPGLLTPHGAKGVALLAQADRAYLARAGVLPPSGCPAPAVVTVQASKVPRAISTGQAWSAAFAPGCALPVQHPAKGAPDSLFHPLAGAPTWFDGRRAYRNAMQNAPGGGLSPTARRLAPLIRRLEAILGCEPPVCDLERAPTTLAERPHDRPSLKGPLGLAATVSQSLLLEYLDAKPMADVGWGLVTPAEIAELQAFNAVKFAAVDRPLYVAKAAAGPLLRAMLEALSASNGSRVALFAGHDTNIADLGGLLDLHWKPAGYPTDTVPPGAALGFELWSDRSGRRFVRATFRSQTMEQLRNLEPLGDGNPPHREYVTIPGCGRADVAESCEVERFAKLVEDKLR
jgi:4-phytase / acid phosphatase